MSSTTQRTSCKLRGKCGALIASSLDEANLIGRYTTISPEHNILKIFGGNLVLTTHSVDDWSVPAT